VNALSLLATHLSRWAEEMILFSTQEFGFIQLPEAYSTGSSAMPQKKNPDLLELTRGKAARVIGDATALQVAVKGLPLSYNKDLQETQEPLFDASETLLTLLPLVTGWMKTVEFDFERMQAAAQSGFMNAWAAATYLVERGVPFRLAHDLSLDELKKLNPVFDQGFYSRLTLTAVLSIHDVVGGTAPAHVREAIAEAKQKIAALRGVAHAHA
jgi:argininosuccinate lyase